MSDQPSTCPVLWPVRQAVHASGWVHEPCGAPTEPGQRYCARCREQIAADRQSGGAR